MMRKRLAAILMVFSAILPLLQSAPASAAPYYARAEHRGYFTNVLDEWGGSVLTNGIHPSPAPLLNGKLCTASFIEQIIAFTQQSADLESLYGAKFIILTMLGEPAGVDMNLAHSLAEQARWIQLVTMYSDNGWISWGPACKGVNATYQYNTYWQGNNGGQPGVQPNPYDDAWFNDPGGSTPDAIIFHNPAKPTDFYMIREECGNPIGDFQPIGSSIAPFAITPSVTVTGSAGSPTHLEQGQLYAINAIATNGGSATPDFTMNATPTAPAPPKVSALSPLNIYSGPTSWSETGFPGAGGTQVESYNLTISTTVPDGSWICFSNTINPASWTAAAGYAPATSPPLCLEVYSTRFPTVQGFNGDIHAGGGLCLPGSNTLGTPSYPGFVSGNSNGGSFGQYVVSASTSINHFGSAGSPGNTALTTLNLGAAGAYTQVCRPDLLDAAISKRPAGAPTVSSPVDVSGLSGVYYFDGPGDLNVSGTVGASVTIVKTSPIGVVRVNGNITRNNSFSYAAHGVPSLGIITDGNIVIAAGVKQVDAYLFANGEIDTCEEGQSAVPATRKQCSNTLAVNGFLMSNKISFRRLGPANVSGVQTAEKVTLSPQIYLNPPKFFDSSVDGGFLEGQGEKQPLF